MFVPYLRNSVLKNISYITSLIRDPLTKTLTIQREKNCSALALYRKLETIKGAVVSAFRMVFFRQKYHNTLCCPSTILHKHCFQFPLGLTIAPRKFENNVFAKFWRNNKEHYGILEKGLLDLRCTKLLFLTCFRPCSARRQITQWYLHLRGLI